MATATGPCVLGGIDLEKRNCPSTTEKQGLAKKNDYSEVREVIERDRDEGGETRSGDYHKV